jgi:hypothetical protein
MTCEDLLLSGLGKLFRLVRCSMYIFASKHNYLLRINEGHTSAFEGFNYTHLASQYIRLRFQFAASPNVSSLFASPYQILLLI